MQPDDERTKRTPAWWVSGLVLLVLVVLATVGPGLIDYFRDPTLDIHMPGMADFFPEAVIWEGTHFSVNRMVIARFLAAIVLAILFLVVGSKLKLRPGRGQVAMEMAADFLRDNIGTELLGTARGKRYSTILGFVFFGVLAMNLTGLLPGINIGASSVMSVPLVFAIFSYVAFVGAGIKTRGGLQFFKEQLFPPGVPWPIYFLLTPIELISTFVVRPATLAIRLLANMIAGHVLLALTYFGTQTLLLSVVPLIKPLSVLTFGAAIIMTLFEVFVSVLQAYVFTILTAVYIRMSVEAH